MAKTKTKRRAKREAYSGELDRRIKTCPACGKHGTVGKYFGVRWMVNKYAPQSQCTACRGSEKVEYEFEVYDDDDTDPAANKVIEEIVNDTLVLSTDVSRTRALFENIYPNNNQKYTWLTMARRLIAKFGDKIYLTPEASSKLAVLVLTLMLVVSPAIAAEIEVQPQVTVTPVTPVKRGRWYAICSKCQRWAKHHPREWGGIKFTASAGLFLLNVTASAGQVRNGFFRSGK